LCALFEAYVAAKQTQGVLDYDDLLLYWAQTVSDPVLAADIGERFDYVLVDVRSCMCGDAVALPDLPGRPKAFPQARTRDHILCEGHRK
jgi:hypothetical protein